MSMKFSELGLSEPILKALDEMGFEAATEVQARAIPPVLERRDLIVKSKTGSGKTAAFGLPLLQLMDLGADIKHPKALILTPTRELAVQVDSDLRQMAKHLKARTTAVYGQHNINVETEALNRSVAVVTGTPGRVFDHIRQGTLVTKDIGFLVLDEADRMLDMGFLEQVVRIIKTLPKDRVTLLFSATMPIEIQNICYQYMKHPDTIEIESETKTVDAIHQLYYRMEPSEKRTQLNRILMMERPESCMIFCNTRAAVDRVQEYLTRKGYSACGLHGDIPQARRLRTIDSFKRGEFHLLVATDVAARGIHVEELSLVINYDVPVEKDSYVHRIGRTGRAGSGGKAITMVTGEDIYSLYEIEEHIGAMISEEELPTDAMVSSARVHAESWASSKVTTQKHDRQDKLDKEHSGVHVSRANRAGDKSREQKPLRDRHPKPKTADGSGKKRPEGKSHSVPKTKDHRQEQGTKPHQNRHPQMEASAHHSSKSTTEQPKGRVRTFQVGSVRQQPVAVAEAPKTIEKKSFFKNVLDRLFGKS